MTKPTEFNFTVRYSSEDEEYLGTCAEFPDIRWLANTPVDALVGIQKLAHQKMAQKP